MDESKLRLRHDRVLVRLIRARAGGRVVLASSAPEDARTNHWGTAAVVEAVGPGLTVRHSHYPRERPLRGAEETRQRVVSDIALPMLVAPGDIVLLGQRYAGTAHDDGRRIVALEEIDGVIEGATEDDVATRCPGMCVLREEV